MAFSRPHWWWLAAAIAFAVWPQVIFTVTAPDASTIENDVLHFTYELEFLLDTSRRPCQDFFGYVCSRSLNDTEAQRDKLLRQEQLKFERFLSADNNHELLDSELKLKQFYDSCRNARSVEDLKGTLLYRQSGGWPAIDDGAAMLRKRRDMTWLQVLAVFHEVGAPYLFSQRIEIISNKRVVHIQPDTTVRYTLRKFEQLADEVMQSYAVEAGRARLVALEILNFERNCRDIRTSSPDQSAADTHVQEFTYDDFKSKAFGPTLHLDWDGYFRKIMGKPLKPTDTVLVRHLPKLVQLFELLQNTNLIRLLNWIWIDYLMDKTTNDCQTLAQIYFEPVYQHIVRRSAIDKVQMAQMYMDLGRAYEELLPSTPWIDEMSHQNSKQFLGRIIYVNLNGDAKLDADYQAFTITKRNFYRNLEKAQRHRAQQQRIQASLAAGEERSTSGGAQMSQAATEYMKVFLVINALLQQQQNLTTPLNFALVGERFAEQMIAAGGSSKTPGAWRSMDSEREFAAFEKCLTRQQPVSTERNYNLNDLVLRILAQQQTWHAYEQWIREHAAVAGRVNSLLAAGRLQLSLPKLYFVGNVLADCRLHPVAERRDFVHSYLRNSNEFTQAFGCRNTDQLFAHKTCKLL